MFFYDYYFFFFADGLQQAWLCLQVREEAVCLAIPAGGTDSRHVRRTKYDSLQTIYREDLDQPNHQRGLYTAWL